MRIEDKENIYYIFEGSPYFAIDNFYPNVLVKFEGMMFANSEAAFQAAKTLDRAIRLDMTTMTAQESKSFGKNPRYMKLRPDWEQVKDDVMYDIVKDKMRRNPECLQVLLSTGDKHIEEGNFWHDKYWGVDYYTRKGRNQLGITLMRLRDEFRQGLIKPLK